MTTVSQLIDQCSGMLHSYTGTVEVATFLTQGVTDTATVLPVAHPTRLLQGLVEIEDELVQVSDAGEDSVTLFPFGRGVSGTTAVAHSVNTKVVNDPLVPRARILEEIQATVRQLSDLYRIKTTTFTSSPVKNTYELPADCRRILKVQYEAIGPTEEWPALHNWTADWNADTPSGKAITIDACIHPAATVQLTYAADLTAPTSTSQNLETDLGIPAEMHDVLRYGACWRLVQMLAPSRLNLRSVEAQTLAQGVTVDSVGKVAQQMFAMFQLRREEEKKRLTLMYPPRKHGVR